ncbi:MAG TPA: hypothetical protein VET89_11445 [Stellaceae bacterium]|jgi:hypothetical protein|nr:hypothetical protein [Stellaceae bacterium]
MTLTEAGQIFDYWRENPPVHAMVQAIARMLGWKPATASAPALAEIAAMAPPGLAVAAAGDLGMPAPVLDIEALRARNRQRLAPAPVTL